MTDRTAWHGSLLVLLCIYSSVTHTTPPQSGGQGARQLHQQAIELYDNGYKGRVLDAVSDGVARLRRSLEPADRAWLEQLTQLATQLSALSYQGADILSPEELESAAGAA